VEVAGRVRDGFAGFGLGGELTRQLRLTTAGGEHVDFLVVVPEHVRLTLELPQGAAVTVPPRQADAQYRWGETPADLPHDPPAGAAAAEALRPGEAGLLRLFATRRPPAVLDIPALDAVRSLNVRVEGAEFRIAASRPLEITEEGGRVTIRAGHEPVDIIVFVPRQGAGTSVHGGGRRLLLTSGGRPSTTCSGVMVQEPTPHQTWFTFHPQAARPACR
jgi:hypothetical protein